MNHEANTLSEAIGVPLEFLNFMSYNVSLVALAKPIYDSKSGIIEAITNGLDAFWTKYPKIEASTSRKEKLILEMTITETTKELIGQYNLLRDEHQAGLKEELAEMAVEAEKKYYAL